MRFLALFVAFVLATGCQTAPLSQTRVAKSSPASGAEAEEVILDHKYFVIHYLPQYRLAKYVKYQLTAEQLKRRVAVRNDRFFQDAALQRQNLPAVDPNAYSKSGYQRGHLAPAEDFRFSQEAIDESFVMSNMAPQKANLNRGPWKKLEDRVRRYACGEGHVTVFTGPILEPDLERLWSGVPIPRRFFKVVIDETPPRKALAFMMNQNDKGNVLEQRKVSFAELQELTKEDFVADLNADEKDRQPAQETPWKQRNCN